MGELGFVGSMPKPLPRLPHVECPFVLRAELLSLVPYSMSTIDRLEAQGKFPKRILLPPGKRKGWVRREIKQHLRQLARRARDQSVSQDQEIQP